MLRCGTKAQANAVTGVVALATHFVVSAPDPGHCDVLGYSLMRSLQAALPKSHLLRLPYFLNRLGS